ncbi:MAG: putative spermidine/putrescine transport system substrate-binding protein, partial [Pseudonocardiales bacterium]|nr:putative spermidine/putrescine transport system substrate-binding protein [Pseudonocardiales bacterium]
MLLLLTERPVMRNRKLLLAGVLCAGLLAAACGTSSTGGGGGGGGGAPSPQGFTPPNLPALDQLGKPEGQLSVLAWPGYAENGSTDPKINWVTPFEQQTGCKVNVKTFATSAEAVQLFATG